MRQSREIKAETHKQIISEASRLFRERGIEGTSVGDVMKAADKTHGGFYRHFASKEAMLIAALEDAFDDQLAIFNDKRMEETDPGFAARFTACYLSPARVADAGGGCPVAALSGEARRGSSAVRQSFGTGTRRMIAAIARTLEGSEPERSAHAARIFAMAAGAVMIARASDPETAELVLDAARSAEL